MPTSWDWENVGRAAPGIHVELLTAVEQALVEKVSRGERLDLAGEGAVDKASMPQWGDSRTCRASVIRDILAGRLVANPDPHGLRLRGARIVGRLDLEHLTTDINFELTECFLEEGILARDAHLAAMSLQGCQIEHPTEPPLDAASFTCRMLNLIGTRIIGHAVTGLVNLVGARVAGIVDFTGANLRNDRGPAMIADSLQVDQGMFLRGEFSAIGAGDLGAVRMISAHIAGQVDLTGANLSNERGPAMIADSLQADQDIFLRGRFTGTGPLGAVSLNGAHIGKELNCKGASLSNASGPALLANGLQVDEGVGLQGRFAGVGQPAAVLLAAGRIGGVLEFDGASISSESGPALIADGLQVEQSVVLRGGEFIATGTNGAAAVSLNAARIGGQFVCDGPGLRNDSGSALSADNLTVDLGMLLCRVTATAVGKDGALSLIGARIGGQLSCVAVSAYNDCGPALIAGSLQVSQDMSLNGAFTGVSRDPAVILMGAHVGGQLSCEGASMHNDSGPALAADSLQVAQDMGLCSAFVASGSSDQGAVRLIGAHVGGRIDFRGAVLRNKSGPALAAQDLEVKHNLSLCDGFNATGAGEDGAINLMGAHVGGRLEVGAIISNDSGPALLAERLQADQVMLLNGEFTARSSDSGAVHLLGAHIGGQLACTGAILRNDSGPALVANSLQVDQDMLLTGQFAVTAGGHDVAVDLSDARIGGAFWFNPAQLEHADDPQLRLRVDGLTYTGVPQAISAQDWRLLLREGTPSHKAQPYQQLAAGYRALGDERQLRDTLIAQRDAQLARTHPGWSERAWGWITRVTLRYGYQPSRALLFLAAVVALSCVLAVVLGSHGALTQTESTAASARPCTVIQQVSVGLDLNLPVGTSLARADCDLTGSPTSLVATWLIAESWVLRVLAWVFAALFIAGFTSAVRRT